MILWKKKKHEDEGLRERDAAGALKRIRTGNRLISLLCALMVAGGGVLMPAASTRTFAEQTETNETNLPAEEEPLLADTDLMQEENTDSELASVPGQAEPTGETGLSEAETYRVPWVAYDYDELYVGNPTPMQGRFFTTLWGGTTSDLDVQSLVHGCSLVRWDPDLGRFRVDRHVVSGLSVENDRQGNRSYHIVLQRGLVYSDGKRITAWDYAYSLLFQMDPAVEKSGGTPKNVSWLLGAEEYLQGSKPFVRGIRVYDDWNLELTVRADALPFFYEMSRLNITPFPRHVITPDVHVKDQGRGAYLSPALTADIIRRNVLDSYKGFLSHPTVSSGPYILRGFDGMTADFEINPRYAGDESGTMPRVKVLHYTTAENASMIRELGEGRFGLLNKVTWKQAILDGVRLQEREGHQYTMSSYPRNGMTLARLTPESKALQELDVRRALALCMDRKGLIEEYVGPYGNAVNGLYGIAQWTYRTLEYAAYPIQVMEAAEPEVTESEETESSEETDYSEEEEAPEETENPETVRIAEEQAAWEALRERLEALETYPLNVNEAVRYLERAGWTLNLTGMPFEPGRDEVRCKKMPDGSLLSLELRGAIPQADVMREALEIYWLPYLRQAGIQLTLEPVGMGVLTEIYGGEKPTDYDLVVVGENFTTAFDPTAFFTLSEAQRTGWEKMRADNEQSTADADDDSLYAAYDRIAQLSYEMGHTLNRELLTYMSRWMLMQEEINSKLPLIPIYSNDYFDVFTRELQDYDIINHVSWGEAMVGAVMGSAGLLEDEDEVDHELSEIENLFMEDDE